MKIHQKSTFKIQQIFERALTVKIKTLNKNFSKKQFLKTSEDIIYTQENFISIRFNSSISSSIHQYFEQQSNAENQMK